MKRLRHLLAATFVRGHRLIARSRRATVWYFHILAWSRALWSPLNGARIYNTLCHIDWPRIDLPAFPVRVGNGTLVRLHPHVGEFDLQVLVSRSLVYEHELATWLESRVAQYDVIVEIGANVGVFTTLFGVRAKPNARILAFEPSRVAFQRLLANLGANDLTNVTALNAAVGMHTGLTTLFEPLNHLTNGSLDPSFASRFSEHVTAVPTVCTSGADLTDLVPDRGKTLLKIDIEGAEALVLSGLRSFICDRQPDLVIEVLPGYEAAIAEAIRGLPYQLHAFTKRGPERRARLEASIHRDWWLQPVFKV
jgi:FkbM family methyltransferase